MYGGGFPGGGFSGGFAGSAVGAGVGVGGAGGAGGAGGPPGQRLPPLPPSRVLYVSGAPPGAMPQDLAAALAPWGRAVYALMLANRSQFLIEMESIDAARSV